MLYLFINPRPTKLFFVTRPTKGGWLPPPLWEFVIKHPMRLKVAPVVSYGPPLHSDTKQVPTSPIHVQL